MADDDDLALAHDLADRARAILRRHHLRVGAWAKPDGSAITEADLEADAALVARLAEARPGDAVLSEEGGLHGDPDARRRWIVDPLDGTSAYVWGDGPWGTLVALEEDGELVVGVVDLPPLDRRYWATRGGGTWRGDGPDPRGRPRPVRLSDVTDLAAARVTAWQPVASPAVRRLRQVGTWVRPDGWFLVRLLEGEVDVLLSVGGEVWDHAAEVLVVEEAGGRFTDPRGGHRLDLRGGLYTNGHLHEAARAVLAGP